MRALFFLCLFLQAHLFAAPETDVEGSLQAGTSTLIKIDEETFDSLEKEHGSSRSRNELLRLAGDIEAILAEVRPHLEQVEGFRIAICDRALKSRVSGRYLSLNLGIICRVGVGFGVYRRDEGDRSTWQLMLRGFSRPPEERNGENTSFALGAYLAMGFESVEGSHFKTINDARGGTLFVGNENWEEGAEYGRQVNLGIAFNLGPSDLHRAHVPIPLMSVSRDRVEAREIKTVDSLRRQLIAALIAANMHDAQGLSGKIKFAVTSLKRSLLPLWKNEEPSTVKLGARDPLASLNNLFNPDFIRGWRTPWIIRASNWCLYRLLEIW